jgi:hypothetical protein
MKPLSWLLTLLLAISVINYPNPFNPKGGEIVTFECTSDSTLETDLYIYDMSARLLLQKPFNLQSGLNRLIWNGYSEANERVGTGIYLYRLIEKPAKSSLAKGKIWVINR